MLLLLKESMFQLRNGSCCIQSASEHRSTKSKSSEAIGFTDKPDVNLINRNYIGPADKISNLRPVLRHIPEDETAIERDLRLKQSEVEQWNQEFWTKHNTKFLKVNIDHTQIE